MPIDIEDSLLFVAASRGGFQVSRVNGEWRLEDREGRVLRDGFATKCEAISSVLDYLMETPPGEWPRMELDTEPEPPEEE